MNLLKSIFKKKETAETTQEDLFELKCELDYLYATNREAYSEKLASLERETLIAVMNFTTNQQFTDPNYSYSAEVVGMKSAGFKPHHWASKHGLDSVEDNAEGKPVKLSRDSKRKFNGSFKFADCSQQKIHHLCDDDVQLAHSGLCEGELLFTIVIPMKNETIRERMVNQFHQLSSRKQRTNIEVNYQHYINNPDVKLAYLNSKIDEFSTLFTKPFLNYLKGLGN